MIKFIFCFSAQAYQKQKKPWGTLSTESAARFDGNALDHCTPPPAVKEDILFTFITLGKNYTYKNRKEKHLLQMIFNTTMELQKPNNKLLMFLHSTSSNVNLKS